MKPGSTCAPVASTVCCAASGASPIATIRPAAMPMSPVRAARPVPSTRMPPLILSSYKREIFCRGGCVTTRIAFVLALATATSTANAGGFGIPDIGVRRTAMGAIVGRPDDGAAIYHNPAGLLLQHGWHLYLSTGLAIVRSTFQLHSWDQSDRFLGVTPGA